MKRLPYCALALLLVLGGCDDSPTDEAPTSGTPGDGAGGDAPGGGDTGGDGAGGETGGDGTGGDVEPGPALPRPWTLPNNPERSRAPEPPAILRDVHLVNDDAEFTRPYVPGYRTTMDGRIGIRVQGGFPGTERIATNYSFFLFVPERLQGPIMPGAAGAEILRNPEPFDVVFPPALEPGINRFGHHVLCDPTEEFPVEGERPNPYACGPDEANDCYDLTLVSATASGLTAQLWGTKVTIEVEQPKTLDARIIRADLGEPEMGPAIVATNELLEPAITKDGKLLTARLGQAPRNWTNPNTGETKFGYYDLVYFPPPEGMEPCDVTAWTEWQPMSHAPYDPRMVGRYGLAAYPFRDTEGNLIPDGDDMGGTYPWVDREGANIFMTAIPGRLSEQSETQYPRRCVHDGCDEFQETINWDRGFLVAGLWTHGKLVLIDAMINHLDWAVGVTPETHWMVDLFQEADGTPLPVRIGSGRFINHFRNVGGPYPPGYTHNANILDSVQNLLNQHPNARTVTPRDVVWLMSNGVATDEVAFDDWLDPDALIVSNMQASITQRYAEDGQDTGVPHYHNGQVRRLQAPAPIPQGNRLYPDEFETIHVQNGATSLRWNMPAHGTVEAGEGRIEPAALGGIKGKGFWLDGTNRIAYEMPAQTQDLAEHTFVYGLFVDPRGATDERRVLLTFPGGERVEMEGPRTVRYIAGDQVIHEIALPESGPTSGWVHLGWRVHPGGQTIELLHDGFPFDRFEAEAPMFLPEEGTFEVGHRGSESAGFRGWVDELKVLAHDVGAEVACNHAFGTLVRVESDESWAAVADRYPAWAHDALAAQLGDPEGSRYACFHDYTDDYAAHLRNIPAGTVGLREALTFPEGPILAGAPRPDSSENSFCLSCHTDEGKGGLGIDALTLNPDLLAEHDPRRQPSQPPRRVFGNIPANWLEGSPAEAMKAPPEGVLVDRWLVP